MANDQGKTGQQGGTTPNNPDGFEIDPRPSEPGQKGGHMPVGQSDMDRQHNAEGVGRGSDDRYQDEKQGTVDQLIKAVPAVIRPGQFRQ